MSEGRTTKEICDFPHPVPSVRDFLSYIGRPDNSQKSGVIAKVLSVGEPRWNTSDGSQPTQSEANRMVAQQSVEPRIYRPLTFEILRNLRGVEISGRVEAIAGSGKVGDFADFACPFSPSEELRVMDGRELVAAGRQYVVIFGPVTALGNTIDRTGTPVVIFIFAVHGRQVLGYGGKLEPLPD